MERSHRPLRLVLITETFPPEVNGVARTLGRWVETFRQRGHKVRIIRPRQEQDTKQKEHVWSVHLPFYPEVKLGVASVGYVHDLLKFDPPDLIHIATEGPLGLAGLLAAARLRVPVATSFHTNFDAYLGHYGLGLFQDLLVAYLRWFHNRTKVTLVPSLGTKQRLEELGFERVGIWSRGVDSELFHPRHRDDELRDMLDLKPDDLLLLYVGRLAPEKNLPLLLQAFEQVRESVQTNVKLALVGGGPMQEQLQAQRTSGIHLAGYQHGMDLARWYANADVFCFPSITETFGNVVLEAMASGLAVVGFDSQGVSERIQHGVDGYLVPLDGDFAAALTHLCREKDYRRQLAAQARQSAERYDWKPIFDELEIRYRKLVRDHPKRRTVPSESATLQHHQSFSR
ncbi:MAG: glycosyltransferase family 4 protein [Gemmataceae bacterium]